MSPPVPTLEIPAEEPAAPRDACPLCGATLERSSSTSTPSDLAAIVADVVPGATVELAPGASPDARNYGVTCGKLAETLGVVRRWNVHGAPSSASRSTAPRS